jgi:flagellar motor protein MotB
MPAKKRRKSAEASLPLNDPTKGHHRPHYEEDSHGWAVSYSDMLMVLMSFFIIFFSFEKSEDNILKEVTMTLTEAGFKIGGKSSDDGDQSGKPAISTRPRKEIIFPSLGLPQSEEAIENLPPRDLSNAIATSLGALGLDIQTQFDKKSLVLNLPEDIFSPGKFTLTEDKQKILETVLNRIKPAMRRVNVAFIGHSDSTVATSSPSAYNDNFILSSLRAWHGLRTAVKLGLPPAGMVVLGAADQMEESRSLSIKITIKDTNVIKSH